MPMHTGPTIGRPTLTATAQPQISIAVGGLPPLSPPRPMVPEHQHRATKHEAGDYQSLHSMYTVRLEDGTKAVAYSATPSPTRKRGQRQRRIQRGEPRHSTPGPSAHHSPTKSPTILNGTASVPLPQHDLGGGFSLKQRAPLYLSTRPGFIPPDPLAPADDPRTQQAAAQTGRKTIARQTLAPALGSPQLPGTARSGGANVADASCKECAGLQAELQRLASLLTAEEAKRRLLTEGLTAARAEIKQQREQLQAKDAEIQTLQRQQHTAADPEGEDGSPKAQCCSEQ